MRLLFLSNLYPPSGSGGYEQWCQEVAEGLRQRGHSVTVLTSRNGLERIPQPEPDWIHRSLHMEMEFASLVHGLRFFTSREAREQENLACLRKLLQVVRPDLVFVWGMWNLPRSLPALVEQLMPDRVVYYLGDYWPILPSQHQFYWQAPAQSWATRLPKNLLRPVAQQILNRHQPPSLQFARVLFPSIFLREEILRLGVPVQEGQVIYGAVDTRPFAQAGRLRPAPDGSTLSLLYAGRLAPEKGVETAIQAMQELVQQHGIRMVKLAIAGGGEKAYVAQLRQMVQQAGLDEWVSFLGSMPKEGMPDLYRQHDVFLFTSTWQEPFGRVLVEALASGLVVIGTATGGAAEILVEDENGLTYDPGEAASLAGQVLRLLSQPSLRQRLVENGRRTALEQFDISRMVAEIEDYLLLLVN